MYIVIVEAVSSPPCGRRRALRRRGWLLDLSRGRRRQGGSSLRDRVRLGSNNFMQTGYLAITEGKLLPQCRDQLFAIVLDDRNPVRGRFVRPGRSWRVLGDPGASGAVSCGSGITANHLNPWGVWCRRVSSSPRFIRRRMVSTETP